MLKRISSNKEEFIAIDGLGEKKFEDYGKDILAILRDEKVEIEQPKPQEKQSVSIYDALKKYRLDKSKELNIKPYFIFNNEQLDALVAALPKTIDELIKINGFGEAKCKTYGEDILTIIKKY